MPKSSNKRLDDYGFLQAYSNYQQAVIVLSKFGFRPREVWAMSHLEASSWISAHLTSLGVKQPTGKVHFNPDTTIISQRRKTTQGA